MAQSAATKDSKETETLPELYNSIVKIQEYVEVAEESTASDSIQCRLKDGIEKTERAINMVNELSLFSSNEDIEEVQTAEIKYMMMSAYMGFFSCLNIHLPRKEAVTKTMMCYKDFLRLCKLYGVVDYNINLAVEEEEDEDIENIRPVLQRRQDVHAMSAQRNSKIERFKEKKVLKTKVAELRVLVEKEHVDDEVKREFYMTQLKQWANYAVDEIDSCALEMQMLKHREEMQNQGRDPSAASNRNSNKAKSFRPFILTKNALQKQVFGAGYPAIATMTVDEFYNEKIKEGSLSESVHGHGHSMQSWAADPEKDARERDKEEAEKEKKIEEEDEETIQRMRAMDDWKDDHRRGDGNRHNKG